jgi:hypothetical protein
LNLCDPAALVVSVLHDILEEFTTPATAVWVSEQMHFVLVTVDVKDVGLALPFVVNPAHIENERTHCKFSRTKPWTTLEEDYCLAFYYWPQNALFVLN